MTGLISGIKRMEIHDGDGIRTTAFFKGCPLKCLWCHNPESISFAPQVAKFKEKCVSCGLCGERRDPGAAEACPTGALVLYGRTYTSDALVDELLRDEAFFRKSGGGVTLSGGECLAQPDFALETARKLRERNVSVFLDTCGFVPRSVLEAAAPLTDVFLYDVKAVDPAVHKACTGRDNALILENLVFLSEKGCSLEIRYPLVVGFNDGECEKIGAFLRPLRGIRRVKVLRYHPFAASRYEALEMENTLPAPLTQKRDVENAVRLLRRFGLPAEDGAAPGRP